MNVLAVLVGVFFFGLVEARAEPHVSAACLAETGTQLEQYAFTKQTKESDSSQFVVSVKDLVNPSLLTRTHTFLANAACDVNLTSDGIKTLLCFSKTTRAKTFLEVSKDRKSYMLLFLPPDPNWVLPRGLGMKETKFGSATAYFKTFEMLSQCKILDNPAN